ncbi:MAG: transcriptional repressor [Peptococcaceae bacterium]|nr:transcriptional repressor [Peptococcaceae bacterium]
MKTVDCALEQLRQNGYKITPQRQEIVRALQEGTCPLSAEDIHQKITARYPNMSLDTVYRNLNILAGLNIVSECDFRDGKNRYELNTGGKHYHRLICLKCGASEKVDFCPLAYLDQAVIEEKKFKIKEHRFELFGYCSSCKP